MYKPKNDEIFILKLTPVRDNKETLKFNWLAMTNNEFVSDIDTSLIYIFMLSNLRDSIRSIKTGQDNEKNKLFNDTIENIRQRYEFRQEELDVVERFSAEFIQQLIVNVDEFSDISNLFDDDE